MAVRAGPSFGGGWGVGGGGGWGGGLAICHSVIYGE